jgi:RNA polymerase sigma factor (sigma-70 family)
MDHEAHDLLTKFLKALGRVRKAPPSSRVIGNLWRLFVEHSWYRAQLRICALHALYVRSAPRQWLEDVEHEAMLILARELRRRPDLNLNRAMASKTFPVWLRTVISRDCLQAIRKLRRQQRAWRELKEGDRRSDDRALRDERADVSMAMEKLARPLRAALSLYSKGYTFAEIGKRMGVSTATAQRIVHRGLRKLQELLGEW